MSILEFVGAAVLALVIGVVVLFLLIGVLGVIAAAMLSAKITHEEENAEWQTK